MNQYDGDKLHPNPNPPYDGFNYPFYIPADGKVAQPLGKSYNFFTMDRPGDNKSFSENSNTQNYLYSIFYIKKGQTWVPKLELTWGYRVVNKVVKPEALKMTILK